MKPNIVTAARPAGERQDDAVEGAELRGAVDRGRVLELLGDRLEEARQQPDRERQRERRCRR
jgi:hypothetical protein